MNLEEIKNCLDCGYSCYNIGEFNKLGIRKSYCCPCYSKIDKDFSEDLWCKYCITRKKEQINENNKDVNLPPDVDSYEYSRFSTS